MIKYLRDKVKKNKILKCLNTSIFKVIFKLLNTDTYVNNVDCNFILVTLLCKLVIFTKLFTKCINSTLYTAQKNFLKPTLEIKYLKRKEDNILK